LLEAKLLSLPLSTPQKTQKPRERQALSRACPQVDRYGG
jgi:hypothetical protein